MSRTMPILAQVCPDAVRIAGHAGGKVDQFILTTIEQLYRMERDVPGLKEGASYRAQRETILKQPAELDSLTARYRREMVAFNAGRTAVL